MIWIIIFFWTVSKQCFSFLVCFLSFTGHFWSESSWWSEINVKLLQNSGYSLHFMLLLTGCDVSSKQRWCLLPKAWWNEANKILDAGWCHDLRCWDKVTSAIQLVVDIFFDCVVQSPAESAPSKNVRMDFFIPTSALSWSTFVSNVEWWADICLKCLSQGKRFCISFTLFNSWGKDFLEVLVMRLFDVPQSCSFTTTTMYSSCCHKNFCSVAGEYEHRRCKRNRAVAFWSLFVSGLFNNMIYRERALEAFGG